MRFATSFIAWLFVLVVVVSSSGCCCCSNLPVYVPVGPSTTGGPSGSADDGGDIDTSLFNLDTSKSVSESNAALQKIAGYLEAGDIKSFNDSLSVNAHALMSGPPDIPADRAASVGQALKNAKVTSASTDLVFYETDIDGESYTFDMIKEGGVWKLDQF